MKSFLIPKLHIKNQNTHTQKNQNTESQFSPKWHSKGTQRSHQDRGDRCVSQEVSNLANSHCQENHKDVTAITKLSLSIITELNFARLCSERASFPFQVRKDIWDTVCMFKSPEGKGQQAQYYLSLAQLVSGVASTCYENSQLNQW